MSPETFFLYTYIKEKKMANDRPPPFCQCSQRSYDRGRQVSADASAWAVPAYTSGRRSVRLLSVWQGVDIINIFEV